MKKTVDYGIICILLIFLGMFKGISQQRELNYLIELTPSLSANNVLPFWLSANKFGTVPKGNHLLLNTAVYSEFSQSEKDFDIAYGASFVSALAKKNSILVNELYGSIRYKKLQLDLGIKHPDIVWEGLSSSNGNITRSLNSRSFPGYNIQLTEFIELPFAKKWLTFKGNYGDYLMNDKRAVSDTRLHIKSVYFKSKLSARTELITGLNHYVQWGGTSSIHGKQPSNFKNYIKAITGSSGGSEALETDQINVLGNQLGSYLLQFNYEGEKMNWSFYYSHPFEDRSGREMMNYPDGLYGFFIDFKKPLAIVSHILTELTYTKHMSGSAPHYTDEQGVSHSASGRDNYFNNGIYQSGWTYFGSTIGSPYFTTKTVDSEGITRGIVTGDNRFLAFNVGVNGLIYKIKYKALLSHVTYYGWFDEEYENKPKQFSGFTEFFLPTKGHFQISVGAAFDVGSYRKDNFGGFIKLVKRGVF